MHLVEFRVGDGDVPPVAGHQPGGLVAVGEGPDPVQLRFECPPFVVERLLRWGGQHRLWRREGVGGRRVVLPQDRQPLLLARLLSGSDQVVGGVQALAVEAERQLAGLLLQQFVVALVEDPHLSGAVVALRDRPREAPVLEGVVLDVDCQRLDPLAPGQPLGHRPGDQDGGGAVEHLEAQVVVEPGGVVLMDDEGVARACPCDVDVAGDLRRGLGGLGERPFGRVVPRGARGRGLRPRGAPQGAG